MSRTAEEQLVLEQRIQAMKLKNEELRRRHQEVEADKQIAAKQNALVKMNVPLDDDWIPGRHDNNPRQDRNNLQNDPHLPPSSEQNDERGQHFDHRRNRNEGHRDDTFNRHQQDGAPGMRPSLNTRNFSGRRNDYQRQKSDDDGYQNSDGRRSGDWSGRTDEGSGGRFRDRGSYSNRGFRNDGFHGDSPRGHTSTFTSKVYKNSSMDPDRSKRASYRLAEGDGPPPDPSYSFLGDSMRDSPDSTDKRRGHPNNKRGYPRGRGRGEQTWSNRAPKDMRAAGAAGLEDAGDPQPRNTDNSRQQTYESAWRRERNLIDQERINRQKTSDGNWSREWDNNKVFQESNDRPQRGRRGNQTQNYERSYSRRSYHDDDEERTHRQNYTPRGDSGANASSHEAANDQPNKFVRRGRFSNQHRMKDNTRFSNGSSQQVASDTAVSKEAEAVSHASPSESNVETVEQLQVSVLCDASGTPKRNVEGIGGNLRISVSTEGEISEGQAVEQKRPRKGVRKGKRSRALSTTSTGTTGTAEGDGSWEDMSSDEDVSVLTELQKMPCQDIGSSKCVDISSGPESLDPIPVPGKEDEFLWDDFHPAGFQDNATLVMDAEAAYQALLDEKAKQDVEGEENNSQPPKVSFRLDTACLEDSGDELEGAKLDPLLVTTQIVQAEVDCMSLTSLPTDTSLPEEISQFVKTKSVKDDKIPEEDGSGTGGSNIAADAPVSVEAVLETVSITDSSHTTCEAKNLENSDSCSEAVTSDMKEVSGENPPLKDVTSDVELTNKDEKYYTDTASSLEKEISKTEKVEDQESIQSVTEGELGNVSGEHVDNPLIEVGGEPSSIDQESKSLLTNKESSDLSPVNEKTSSEAELCEGNENKENIESNCITESVTEDNVKSTVTDQATTSNEMIEKDC